MTVCTEILLGICSDTHGDQLPQWPGRKLNAVLHAGDIYDAGAVQYGEYYVKPRPWAAALSVQVLAVRGNHDFRDPDGFFKVAEDISGRLYRLADGLWIAGVGFAPEWYCDTPGESDLEPQCHNINRMANRQVMPGEPIILLTHYPPRLAELPCDEASMGCTYQCIADLADRLLPVAIVIGHQHDWFGRQWRRQDGTLIVSPGPRGGLLTIPSDEKAAFVIEMRQ